MSDGQEQNTCNFVPPPTLFTAYCGHVVACRIAAKRLSTHVSATSGRCARRVATGSGRALAHLNFPDRVLIATDQQMFPETCPIPLGSGTCFRNLLSEPCSLPANRANFAGTCVTTRRTARGRCRCRVEPPDPQA